MKQRLYHQKNLTIINAPKHDCYYKRKLAALHKRKEMNAEKEASFRHGRTPNELGLTRSFGRNKILNNIMQVTSVGAKKGMQ